MRFVITKKNSREQQYLEDRELQDHAFRWMAALPSDVHPLETGHRFPRILNHIASVWADAAATEIYLRELITPIRPGRQGFPTEVAEEIARLYRHHQARPGAAPPATPATSPSDASTT